MVIISGTVPSPILGLVLLLWVQILAYAVRRCHIIQHIRLCLCTSFCTTNRLTYLLSANLLWHRIKRPYHELNWKWTINYHFFTSLHTIIVHIAVHIWWGDSLTFVQRTVYALVKEPQFNSNSNAQLQCSRGVGVRPCTLCVFISKNTAKLSIIYWSHFHRNRSRVLRLSSFPCTYNYGCIEEQTPCPTRTHAIARE